MGWTSGVRFQGWAGKELSLLSHRVQTETNHPPIQWVPGLKQPDREADHSPPSSAKVKNVLSYTSLWRGTRTQSQGHLYLSPIILS